MSKRKGDDDHLEQPPKRHKVCPCTKATVLYAGSFECVVCRRWFLDGAALIRFVKAEWRPDHPVPFAELAGLLAMSLEETTLWEHLKTIHRDADIASVYTSDKLMAPILPLIKLVNECTAALNQPQRLLLTEDELRTFLEALTDVPNIKYTFGASGRDPQAMGRLPLLLVTHLLMYVGWKIIPGNYGDSGTIFSQFGDLVCDPTDACYSTFLAHTYLESFIKNGIVERQDAGYTKPIDGLRLVPEVKEHCQKRRSFMKGELQRFLPGGVCNMSCDYFVAA